MSRLALPLADVALTVEHRHGKARVGGSIPFVSSNPIFPWWNQEGTVMTQIIPVKIYPIGEFPDGSRLCASVEPGREVDWFAGHRDFDLPDDDDDWVIVINQEDVPTLSDEEMQKLLGVKEPPYTEWN